MLNSIIISAALVLVIALVYVLHRAGAFKRFGKPEPKLSVLTQPMWLTRLRRDRPAMLTVEETTPRVPGARSVTAEYRLSYVSKGVKYATLHVPGQTNASSIVTEAAIKRVGSLLAQALRNKKRHGTATVGNPASLVR